MNREQAKKYWPLIKAYGEGKDLQYRKVGETEWHDERKHLGFCFDVDDCEFRIKPEDTAKDKIKEYTDAWMKGEHILSEKHCRPFEDTTELMLHYAKHFNYECENYCEPIIWVKDKNDNRFLITGFNEECICIEREWVLMSTLFEKFVFLDGSACGVENEI